MAKYCIDAAMDAALNYIKTNTTEMYVCSAQPTTRTQAASTYKLVGKTGLTSADFTGPADRTGGGRKLTVNAQSGLTATASGTPTHIALCSATALIVVTENTGPDVTSGSTENIAAWDYNLPDPV